jgi:hypothetical protein
MKTNEHNYVLRGNIITLTGKMKKWAGNIEYMVEVRNE